VRIGARHHFTYEDGTFYRPVGTTCYAWNNQDDDLAARTLHTLSGAPFNKLRMCVFPKHYDFNANEPPSYAFAPGSASSSGRWDYSRFDPGFFRRLEGQIAALAKLGIEADLILFHPYDRWGFADMGAENDERYLRHVVARLAAFRNVWWSLSNEYDLMPWKTIADWDRLFKIVQECDPWDHLRSIHNCRPFYDHGKPWITQCSIQHGDLSLATDWLGQFGKPVVVDECKYEGNLPLRWGDLTAQEMVNRFWEGFARGAYVGHGETYLRERDEIWWAKGGDLVGGSPARIAFLRSILEEGPAEGLEPANLGKTVHAVSGVGDSYFLIYLGSGQPAYKNLTLPEGRRYEADIIDAWDMTVTRAGGACEGACRIELPGKPYIAIRLRKIG